ncbi:MAG: hypothetical protein LAO31_06865 [Acidobacteriia bacterium]|nr:hypothetical protein [Terriglobia bacterium]
MTVEEDLDLLTDDIRKLKIEYEIFFNGGSKKPPVDLRSRVEKILKKYGDTQKLNSHQRFRYNTLASRFSLFCDLWRNRMRAREEGNDRRIHIEEIQEAPAPPPPPKPSGGQEVLFKEVILKPEEEHNKILKLYENLKDCRETYHDTSSLPSLGAFEQFVSQKAEQLKKSERCSSVAFMIVLVDDRVKFQAAPVRSTDSAPNEPVKS